MAERLEIIVQDNGTARVVGDQVQRIGREAVGAGRKTRRLSGGLDRVERSARAAGGSAQLLRQALTALGGIFIVRELGRLNDAFIDTRNRIKTVSEAARDLESFQERLLRVANETRTSYQSTVEIFARSGRALEQMGVSADRVIGVTRTLNQAALLSGASAQEANAALIQLSQGFASGELRGEEFRSVAEQMPVVLQILQKEFDATQGELREMAFAGQLTTERVFKALEKAGEQVGREFSTLTPTISQSFQVLQNNLINFVGELNELTGIGSAVATTLRFIARNLEAIGAVVATVGTALTIKLTSGFVAARLASISFVPSLLAAQAATLGFGSVIRSLTSALMANPLFTGTVIIATLAAVSDTFRDFVGGAFKAFKNILGAVLELVLDFVKTLGDIIDKVKELLSFDLGTGRRAELAKRLEPILGPGGMFTEPAREVFDLSQASFVKNTDIQKLEAMAEALEGARKKLSDLSQTVRSSRIFEVVRDGALNVADALNLNVKTLGLTSEELDKVTKDYADLLGELEPSVKATQTMLEKQGALAAAFNAGIIDASQFAQQLGQITAEALEAARGADVLGDEMDRLLGDLFPKTQVVLEFNSRMQSLIASFNEGEKSAAFLEEATSRAVKALKDGLSDDSADAARSLGDPVRDLAERFRRLEETLDPQVQKQREIMKGFDLIRRAVDELGLPVERAIELQKRLKESFEESERSARSFVSVIEESLTRSLETMSRRIKDAQGAIKATADALEEEADRRRRIADDILRLQEELDPDVARFREQERGIQLVNEALQSNIISLEEANRLTRELGKSEFTLELESRILSTNEILQETLLTTFDELSRAMADFARTGSLDFREMASSIAASVLRITTQVLAARAALALVGGGGGGAGFFSRQSTGSAILSLGGMQHGGSFQVGGTGGPDSKLVAFRASPGETVDVNTPAQRANERRGDEAAMGGGTTVVNASSPEEEAEAMMAALDSERAGRIIVNHIARNPARFRSALR